MAISRKSSTDYTGRTVDLLVLSYISKPVSEVQVTPQIVPNPRRVSGIEKLAQRFALIFLTQIDSIRNVESEGTELMGLIGSGKVYDTASLNSALASANKATYRQIRNSESGDDTPPDERLASSEITEVVTDRKNASFSVTIKITSSSGDSFTYITPISLGV